MSRCILKSNVIARLGLALVPLIAAAAAAQSAAPPPSPPLTGPVEALQGAVLTVKSPQAGSVQLTLPPNVQIINQQHVSTDAIKSGLFVGVTATEGKDGKLHASEVHIFPESMRGTGEGHYPWQGLPNTTMTNGSVTLPGAQTMTNGNVKAAADKTQGVVLRVDYKGGESEIEVGNDVPVTLMVSSGTSALKPGTPVLAFVTRNPDDSASARMIVVNPAPPGR